MLYIIIITILPSSTDKSRPRFLDITFYPMEKGKELSWFNDDEVDHRVLKNSAAQDNKTILSDSGVIKPNELFAYKFEKSGTYHFSSPTYPWIKGTVFVTEDDDITTVTETDSKNDIDVQLSWNPSTPKVGQKTHFKIIFVNNNTGENQEHIDYRFTIEDPEGNTTDATLVSHSGWGVEPASYKFEKEGQYKARIAIFNILFVPVEVGVTEYEITATGSY
jgi:hypothetical protein